ncbi:hypothetical protein FACS189447_04060 [Spirochaetia bacterium]|nr:hypothetical protein FACS189447_04060 [Spirochaetia bacterium]
MVTLEQVKLLETKITKAIDIVKKVTDENSQLKGKLDSYQRRIDELEILIQEFKEEQGRIEDGVLSALDRLNQFEDAVETAISRDEGSAKKPAPKSAEPAPEAKAEPKPTVQPPPKEAPAPEPIDDELEDLEDTEDEPEIDNGDLELF